MKRLSRAALLLIALVATTLAVVPTAAHAEYRSSVPANGSTVAVSPAHVVLAFSQETSATQSRGQVTDTTGAVVSTGRATVDLNDRTKMTIPLRPSLPNGVYTVNYTSQSPDMHVVEGSFVFTIVPPAANSGAPWGTWLIVFAVATLVVAGGLVVVRRQTRAAEGAAAGVDVGEAN